VAQVLLVGKDWKSRALLRAQLLEEGVDVEACESLPEALEASIGRDAVPSLLIADLFGSSDPAVDVAQLTHWSKRIPIWVIASRSAIEEKDLQDGGFEAVLFRPLDVGELVERIKRRVKA
jgi:CheY-like chemotaxis protein